MTKKERLRLVIPVSILLVIAILASIMLGYLLLQAGTFSTLKYKNGYDTDEYFHWKFLNPPNAEQSIAQYSDTSPMADKLEEWTNAQLPLMTQFVEEKYGIQIDIPKIYMRFSNAQANSKTIKNGECVYLCLSNLYADEEGVDVYAVILHECFHILATQKGSYTTVASNMNAVSMLAEGFTNMLTDEFIDRYNLDIHKIQEYQTYNYYTALLRCLFLELSEKDFARFYFLQDSKFTDDFNIRFSKNSHTSKLFNGFEKLEFRLHLINTGGDDSYERLYSYYSSLEMLAYFMKGFKAENKERCKECVEGVVNVMVRDNSFLLKEEQDEFCSNILEILSVMDMQVQFVPAYFYHFVQNVTYFLYM